MWSKAVFRVIPKNAETRRCPCVKGFGRFGCCLSDGCRYAPKPRALPSELHPVMKLKGLTVCSQPCGQRRIFGRFRKLRKTRRCPCVKGFGRFDCCLSDGCRYAPKPRALPSELHPGTMCGGCSGEQGDSQQMNYTGKAEKKQVEDCKMACALAKQGQI